MLSQSVEAKDKKYWTTVFISILCIGICWVFAMPIFSGPDESVHLRIN